jgi:ferric-dicitrate binding protein FerR (iron transport regulator)
MNEKLFMTLATRYLSKEASVDETELLHSLLKQKKYSTLFDAINEKWTEAGNAGSRSEYSIERGLALLVAKIRNSNSSFQWDKEDKHKYIFSSQQLYLRVAASIVFLIILVTGAFIIIDIMKQKSVSVVWNEKRTMMGEKTIITLLDGTRITLDADSKLTYPMHFGEGPREVYLEGEAYFEVIHDANKPFIVHTGVVSTTDLGTKFNVNAFPDDENIIVSLEEGKVGVSMNESGVKKGDIILAPTQQLIYNKGEETNTVQHFDLQKAMGWKDNILIFDNEPLSKVLISLERSFGVKFELADQRFAHCIVKANFRNESFWTVTEVLMKATGLTYETIKENNELKKVVFHKN